MFQESEGTHTVQTEGQTGRRWRTFQFILPRHDLERILRLLHNDPRRTHQRGILAPAHCVHSTVMSRVNNLKTMRAEVKQLTGHDRTVKIRLDELGMHPSSHRHRHSRRRRGILALLSLSLSLSLSLRLRLNLRVVRLRQSKQLGHIPKP